MSDIIGIIHSEHGTIMRILARLEKEIGRFERGKRPNFELLKDIADYFLAYSGQCHHPREDVLYDALAEKSPGAAEIIGDLREEHEVLARQAGTFADGLASILMEVEISRPAFVAMARNFIARQKHHLALEEKNLLPLARAELSEEELEEITRRAEEALSAHDECRGGQRLARTLEKASQE